MRVLAFGDSIMYGAWDTEGGWVDRLKREAHQQVVESQGKTKLQIINLGIGGDTSSKILKRMPHEIAARQSTSWQFAMLFSFGTNDQRSLNGIVETPLEQFELNVRQTIELARKHTAKILFVGAPPLSAATVMLKGKEYSDERLQEYDQFLRSIVEAEGLPFVPTRPAFEQANKAELFGYDLHPNDVGHALIAKIVKPELWKLLDNTIDSKQ